MPELVRSHQTPHHRLTLRGQLGALQLDFAASFAAPWTVLFGPSGCGKSTVLRALAGVLPNLSRGEDARAVIEVSRRENDRGWLRLADSAMTLPPERRDIGYAPQSALLFPHLSVCENVRFAGALSKAAPTSLSPLVEQACELFELAPLWRRLPAELSGGEQQRVNLARAFARPGARLLLLDEPFTGLDRALRERILERLPTALAARYVPVISVTHDIEEAFLLKAEVVRLEAGQSLRQGPASEVLASERSSLLLALEREL